MSFGVVDSESQKPLARFEDEAEAIEYLRSLAKTRPGDAARLAIVQYDARGLATAAWDLDDLEPTGTRLPRPVRH